MDSARSWRVAIGMVTGLAVLGSAAACGSTNSVSTAGSVNSSVVVTTVASMGLSLPPTATSAAAAKASAAGGSTTPGSAVQPVVLKPVTVPTKVLRSDRGGVAMLAPVVLNGQKFLFIVDTGAAGSVIDAGVAKSLGLPTKGQAIVSKGLACRTSAQPVIVTKWSVGGEALPAETMVATDIGFTGKKVDGVVVGGLLGADVYSVFGSVSLDYTGHSLALGAAAPTGQKSFPIQVKMLGGQAAAFAATTINGVAANLLVDTGASTTELDSELVTKAHLQKTGSPIKIGTVGCTVQAQPVVIDGLSAGTVAMPKSTGVSRDNSSTASASGRVNQGLLGADVLSTFGKVTVDFKYGKVTLGG